MKLRGYLALLVLFTGFLFADLVQRFVVSPWVRLRPGSRIRVLGAWIQLMARFVMGCVGRIGGAHLQLPPRTVPSGPGTMIVMNHQSVMDIPLVVRAVHGGYPRIVTRARYHRFIPLISHMVRLYQYPIVDPTADRRAMVQSLRAVAEAGRVSDVPIAIFPEGTRSRDGEIGPFKKRGVATLLAQRPWTIHLFVSDGYWRSAKLKHFLSGMSHIRGRVAFVDTMEWEDPTADADAFIDTMRERMVRGLTELREEAASG